jgi:hypothetical protein
MGKGSAQALATSLMNPWNHYYGPLKALTWMNKASLVCSSDTFRGNGLPTLGYGSTWPVNPITCDCEQSGMTYTEAGSGHYFRASCDSYELH